MSEKVGVKKLKEMTIVSEYENDFNINELQYSLPLKITKDFDVYLEEKSINIIFGGNDYYIYDDNNVISSKVDNHNAIGRCKEGMNFITNYLNNYIENNLTYLNREARIKLNFIIPLNEKEMINIKFFNLLRNDLDIANIGSLNLTDKNDCHITIKQIKYDQVIGLAYPEKYQRRATSSSERRVYIILKREFSKISTLINEELEETLSFNLYSIDVEGNNIDKVNSYSDLLISKTSQQEYEKINKVLNLISQKYADRARILMSEYSHELPPSARSSLYRYFEDLS